VKLEGRRVTAFVDLADRPGHNATGKAEDDLLHIGCLSAVFDGVAAAEAGNGLRRPCIKRPPRDVEVVRPEVRHLPAGVIPEPAKMIDAAKRIEGDGWRGPEPHIPIEIGWEPFLDFSWNEAGHRVAAAAGAYLVHLADHSVPNELHGSLVVRARALLAACLHYSLLLASFVDHDAAFLNGEGQRLFDVNVFAGAAGHHGLKSVPVVGSCDENGIDVFAIEQLAKVFMGGGPSTSGLDGAFRVWVVHVADSDGVHVGLLEEALELVCSSSSAAYDAEVDAVVGA
jgi:hypothetical protein